MTETDSVRHLTWQKLQPREARWESLGQKPAIAWFTGLSGAGKSSIANTVDRVLTREGIHSMVLDGDNLRHGLNRDLGFSAADRNENIRRVAETARLMTETGLVVIVSMISPFRAERDDARRIAGDIPFLEVFIDTPLAVCEARDPKGLYDRARAGEIPQFTGISAPYEPPLAPDLKVETQHIAVEDSARPVIERLRELASVSSIGRSGVVGKFFAAFVMMGVLWCDPTLAAGGIEAFGVGADIVAKSQTTTLQTLEAQEKAIAETWSRMPLTQRNVTFVSEKASLFGDYKKRDSNVFSASEPLVTYVEPVGYTWKPAADGRYGFGITLDFKIKTPDGKIIAGQDGYQSFGYDSHAKVRELFINITMTLSGITPGTYVLAYTIHDRNSDKASSFDQPFVIKE